MKERVLTFNIRFITYAMNVHKFVTSPCLPPSTTFSVLGLGLSRDLSSGILTLLSTVILLLSVITAFA
ncbi:hypothetical protein GIB67_040943 [Kingdonia uniflora]|uniref:Uncharacterized protein n=1 Tax=Kingdonia uniflora TaxID=39325 RepID=A0A7J7LY36_9MAGN|nr:hypothetical protein GIB67_040943 [Kingdonia uniflora]